MKPVIVLVGRPNVGKSTLFNCLTRSRDALVADQPGLTRDRKYGEGKYNDIPFIVIDTGGLSGEPNPMDELMAEQVKLAIEESNLILFLVDARDGILTGDEEIAKSLRRYNKKIVLIVNKIDGVNADVVAPEFYSLGLGDPVAISASNNRGIGNMLELLLQPRQGEPILTSKVQDNYHEIGDLSNEGKNEEQQLSGIKVAVVGKPNVGKSTLVNRILGEDRVLTFDMPGTTRDSIYIPFRHGDENFVLIDTAGVRRKSRVDDKLEKFSVIKTLHAIDACNVVLMVIDAHQGISDQDSHLLGYVLDSGRALVIAVNKWDGLTADQREQVRADLDRKLQFCSFAKIEYISALHGSGVGKLYQLIQRAYQSATMDEATSKLTRILETAVDAHQPPLVKGRRIKLRYAHQGGRNPPIIVIHGNQTEKVPLSYRRYLTNYFMDTLKLEGTPVKIQFSTGDNPFKNKRNTLTRRQIEKKKRLKKHVKKTRN